MKIVINVDTQEDTISNNDILVYNKKKEMWEVQKKDYFLRDMNFKVNNYLMEVKTIEQEMINLKADVNSKLEDYHKILQTLTKGE